ncbi:hypothetical protein CACET_c27050 [Clostridium aceticum]|uniref:Uncharacterized protein n=1 Tax=Clostridium aceticum TaxID=84022 RepID=A0A0D8I8I2_9CLOT|nr:hypothetical protein [Clostridium aceticum]AKL96150.1 hypothetical protein CACET_c27050 [Clostridium aceticum]KJF26573.1 hypothetical protein TZ02_11900 [Clostridium aceticum]
MSKILTINTIQEAEKIKDIIVMSCNSTTNRIKSFIQDSEGIDFFHTIKFTQIGKDPIKDTSLNFIEQLNQTFTYLVSIEATKYLLKLHPEHAPYTMNLGTQSGYDILSNNGNIIAEVFSATSPTSNDKINKDCKKLIANETALLKYVFFYCKESFGSLDYYHKKFPDIKIIQINI